MGIFDRFPYSSTHEMNLDFMLGKATEIAEDMQTVTAGMAQVQAGLSAISEKTEQATQAAAQAAQSASSIEGSVSAAEEAAEEAQMHNESAQTWANNAMTYKADCQRSATEAAASSASAAQAATAAAGSEDTVATYAQAANASAQSAANNNDSAHQYANQASASASNATFHSSNAQTAATNANTSATNAETAATNAQTAATRTAALKDDCETLHRMCTAAVDQAATEAVNAANSAAQAAATKTDVENLVESLPEDFTDLNNTVNQLSDEIAEVKGQIEITWTEGKALQANGRIGLNANYKISNLIYVGTLRKIKYNVRLTNTTFASVYKYDQNHNFIEAVPVSTSGIQTGVISGCAYAQFCTMLTYADTKIEIGTILTNPHTGMDFQRESIAVNRLIGSGLDVYANLIDRNEITDNAYIDGTNGMPISYDGEYCTGYVPLVSGKSYLFQNIHTVQYAFYNGNFEYISGSSASADALSNPFTAPSGAVYGRFTLYSDADKRRCAISPVSALAMTRNAIDHIPVSVETLSAQINPIHHIGKEFSTFSRCLCIGDSLTEGYFDTDNNQGMSVAKYSYPANLQRISGIECVNKGTAGLTTKTWYEYHENDDFSGYDICIIALGINDAYASVSADVTADYLGRIIDKVKNANNGIRIFVSSCFPSHDHVAGFADVNATLQTVAETKNAYFLDMAQYSELRKTSQYINGHLTAIGYNKLAQELYAYIGWTIFTNPDGFANVQFIGQ